MILGAIQAVFATVLALVLLTPSHVRVPRGPLPAVAGQAHGEVAPAQTLDCGSVIWPGPNWSSEGGTCNDSLSERRRLAIPVGLMTALAAAFSVVGWTRALLRARGLTVSARGGKRRSHRG